MPDAIPAPAAGTAELNPFVATPLRFAGVFTADECARIVAMGESHDLVAGTIVRPREDYRRTSVAWLRRDAGEAWLFDKLDDLFSTINHWYRFRISLPVDNLQFARYDPGDSFGWHIDCGGERASMRKISLSVQLTDPADYDGGGLEFVTQGELAMSRIQGSVIAFPAFVCHRVTPVTRGTRHALVAWAAGPPYS